MRGLNFKKEKKEPKGQSCRAHPPWSPLCGQASGPLNVSAADLGCPALSRRALGSELPSASQTVTGDFWSGLHPWGARGAPGPQLLGCFSPREPHLTQLLGQRLFLQIQPPAQG